jgi:hypothetical protein
MQKPEIVPFYLWSATVRFVSPMAVKIELLGRSSRGGFLLFQDFIRIWEAPLLQVRAARPSLTVTLTGMI